MKYYNTKEFEIYEMNVLINELKSIKKNFGYL